MHNVSAEGTFEKREIKIEVYTKPNDAWSLRFKLKSSYDVML
jgi:hypothetical protein